MSNTIGKRLLILGGTSASLDLVKNAKKMGIYTIVTDNSGMGVAKQIADEVADVSTTDLDGLAQLVKSKNVDGVFCGPSEFNLRNVIALCEKVGIECYTTTEVWDRCANKDVFKNYCREYDVDCTPEYPITLDTPISELEKIDYPIIIKPVDGCSSAGISVCHKASEVKEALEKAYAASKAKKIIAEKYIENGGEIFCVRYLLKDGEAYPYYLMDTYVVDPVHRTSLISGFAFGPSKYSDYYMKNMDAKVRKMLKGMGLKNGTAFIQSLPCDGKIYFHEMGYRLSGGMVFKVTEPLVGINDMQIMLRGAVGCGWATDEELNAITLDCKGKCGCQLMLPLSIGTISRIEGLDKIKEHKLVTDFIQYYNVGDSIEKRNIGTLGQHFGRVTFIANSTEEALQTVEYLQNVLKVYDQDGNIMNNMPFDIKRFSK